MTTLEGLDLTALDAGGCKVATGQYLETVGPYLPVIDEVAVAMGVSDNSVKKHLQRGLAHLRRTVPAEEGADLGFT